MKRLDPMLREPGFGRPREPGVLACLAYERALAGRRSARVSELAERALEGGALADPHALPGPECFAACCALVWADSLSTAEIALTMALESAGRRGHTGAAAAASRFRAWAVLQRGRLSHAAADALDSSGAEGDGPTAAVPSAAMILAEVDMEQGRLEEAALLLEDPAQRTSWEDGPRHAFHLAARGRLHFLRGEHELALEDLLECGRRLESLGIHNPSVLPWRSRAAVAAAAGHDRARAMSLATAEVSLARTFGAPRALGVALRAAALVGPPEERLAGLREATECLERSPGALDRARALIDLGGELRRGGQRREARERLRVGLDLAHRCEATVLAAHAHQELVAAGARPRRERLSGSEALTPRERQVAQLAARGVRNRAIAQRLFITQKTVEWHLGNAFRKLELHSRDSLIGALGDDAEAEGLGRSGGRARGPRHHPSLVEPPDLGVAQPEHLGEHLVGVLAQHGRGRGREPGRPREVERRARHEVGADAGLLHLLPHRVRGRAARILVHELGEGLVRRPGHAVPVEELAQLGHGPREDPGLERGPDHLPRREAAALVVQVHVHELADGVEGLAQPGGLHQPLPLSRR